METMGGHPSPNHRAPCSQAAVGSCAVAGGCFLRNCVLSSLFGMVTDEQCDMPLLTRPTPHPGHGQTRPLLRLKKGQDFGVLHSACLRNESLVSAQQSPCARPAIPAWPSSCYRHHSLLLVLPRPPVSASHSQQVDVHYGV